MILPAYFLVVWATAFIQGREIENDGKRIAGGQDAPEGGFPWQASVRNIKGRQYHVCGGSIIGKKWILTAAHCSIRRTADSLAVVVGSNKLSSGGKGYKVQSIINHKGFNPSNAVNDIGLLKLAKDIEYNDRVKPIELDNDFTGAGVVCTISGWGYTDNNKRVPDKLKMLKVTTLSVRDCSNKLANNNFKYTQKNICTFNRRGEGFCQGDSGGPLIRNNKQVGIVSWNTPCGKGYPDVYTRVSSYIGWIRDNAKN